MATIDINMDDNKFVPHNDVVQTHEPPPSYAHINTQVMQNPHPHQHQNQQLFVQQNGQMIPAIFVNNGMNGYSPYSGPILDVHDYTVWSVFNILCCGFWCGLCALALSLKTRTKKRNGDLQGAKEMSKWAAIWNVVATVFGIIAITLIALNQTGNINLS
jgi:hypothetical protein